MDKQQNAAFSAELIEKLKLKRALGRIQRLQAKIQGVPAGQNQAQTFLPKPKNSFISDGL
ncbi:TPA: hypothetical protein WIU78_000977 [Neisseria meningitidis]